MNRRSKVAALVICAVISVALSAWFGGAAAVGLGVVETNSYAVRVLAALRDGNETAGSLPEPPGGGAGTTRSQYLYAAALAFGGQPGPSEQALLKVDRAAALENPAVAFRLGVLLYEKGERTAAIPLLQAASGRAGAYLLKQGRTKRDIESYRLAVAIDPALKAAWREMEWLLFQSSQWDQAADAAQHVLALDPTDTQATVDFALFLQRSSISDPGREQSLLMQALQLDPKGLRPRMGLGQHALVAKNLGDAEVWFQQAAAADPGSDEPWIGLVQVALARSESDEAVRLAGEAISRKPLAPSGWYMLGLAQLANRNPSEAVRAFEGMCAVADTPAARELVERARKAEQQQRIQRMGQ